MPLTRELRPAGQFLADARGVALVALCLLAVAQPPAQGADERQRLSARLQALGPLEPIPDSPLNRDVGEIAILEHDGSSYDRKLADGTANYEARARVGLRFYATHPDDYDFLVVFTNFDFDTGGGLAFHSTARNDVQGIGVPVGSIEAMPFGSRSRLKGWIDMASVSRYRSGAYSVERGGPEFLRTLGVLAHEMGHQWLAEARYKVDDTIYDDLLGADETHWSYLLDSDGSFLYGADWRADGGGAWTAARVREQYSALDLYLMGLLPKEKVAPLTLLRNPAVDRHQVNAEGETILASETTTVLIDQIVAALGPRTPGFAHSQKEFRLGFVFLAAPGSDPSAEDLEAVERVRRAFGAYFFALTNGVGWADTTLGTPPPWERAGSPDLARALAWLAARQDLDGSWADAPETRARDSAAAVTALSRARAGLLALQRGIAWLRGAQPESLDFRARVAAGLEPSALTPAERQGHLSRILAGQNADGGWGAARDFASDALDTALALRALKSLGHPLDARVTRGVEALGALASADGGWSGVLGDETSTVATAEALLALLDWSDAPGSAAVRARGLAALVERRNPDGGFGSSPSTPQASALALEVLLRSGAGPALVDPLSAWLQEAQLSDGSWASSPYQTALAVSVLGQSTGANLQVPADSVAADPNPVREGEPVRISARVRNGGRAEAPATVARLYDGDPTGTALAEAAVPVLPPGQEAEVAFDYATVDRPGRRTLYVVADATSRVLESREDDNTASVGLTVEGLLADLVLRPEAVSLDPASPAVGEAATVRVEVENLGERTAGAFVLSARITDPSGEGVDLPLGAVGGLAPGGVATVSLPWVPQQAGPHTLRVRADARYAIAESDETNADVTRQARVLPEVRDGAELSVAQAEVVPGSLQELPQPIELRALVVNSGRSAVVTRVDLRDGNGETLGSVELELPGRSERWATITATILNPGGRVLSVVVDADGLVEEADETDNALSVGYGDAGTVDVEIADAALAATEVERGELVTVTVEVKNRGTLEVLTVPVQLTHLGAGGPSELDREDIRLGAGETRSVVLSWRASIEGDVSLVVRADPFGLLVEQREDNNDEPLALRVGPPSRANLSVGGAEVTLDPDPLVEGASATLTAVVRNLGGAEAGPSLLRFVVGDPDRAGRAIGEVDVGALAAGESRPVSLAWPRVDVRGALGLFVVADAGGAVDESNEDDNRAFRPFSATGLPDLVLTAADVRLTPPFPREGEAVTIHATVRNLGGRPSAATTLDLAVGDLASQTGVGQLAVPALDPGAFAGLSLDWTPSGEPGERTLFLSVDADELVTEQDEGNNAVARTVVVQDADLYVTEPFFSPDGDGVKDRTTIAWRSTGKVGVVVSNSRGKAVRALVEEADASGSATWDGKDERGFVAPDGSYRLTLFGDGGARLGDVSVVLDTNRSPIHDATPGRTTFRNLTCSLPDQVNGPALMPAEDEALFVVNAPLAGFPTGLVRAGPSGHVYIAQDDWYRFAGFASPVSPDGREVLMYGGGGIHSVDLVTGERRRLDAVSYGSGFEWSPDGRFFRAGNGVFGRDGSLLAPIGGDDADWSPSSDRLVSLVGHESREPEDEDDTSGETDSSMGRVRIVARDGTLLDSIAIPRAPGRDFRWYGQRGVVWREDGRIVATIEGCPEPPGDFFQACEESSWVVDPETRAVTPLPFVAWPGAWSPDGSRVLLGEVDGEAHRYGDLLLENGTSLGPLLPSGANVGPRSVSATFGKARGDTSRPGTVCGGKLADVFLVSSAANLVADLELARAAGNAGIVVRGTAADRHLEHFQLDYASQADPQTWIPIGAALDTPVLDDVLTVWAPPGPGTYVLRLAVSDRAGHTAVRTRTVAWDRVPALANFTQSDYYLSPEENGVKDHVTFKYTVVSPTRVDVRVVGPEPMEGDGPAPHEVWRAAFEHPATGPQSFTWNGRDLASDSVVPDGRYTVYINDLPFRVEVDNTPPQIGMRFENLRPANALVQGLEGCGIGGLWRLKRYAALSSVAADRAWHVVDERLKSWVFGGESDVIFGDTEPVFVAEPGSQAGRPRVRRENGVPVDRVDAQLVLYLAGRHDLRLDAWDLAGNHSELGVPPLPEALVPLGAVDRGGCEILAAVLATEASGDDGPAGKPVTALRPEKVVLQAGSSLRTQQQDLELVMRPVKGGDERSLPLIGMADGHSNLEVESFEALGIDPTLTYRGRFAGNGEAGRVESAPFVFCPCKQWLRAFYVPASSEHPPFVWAIAHIDVAVEKANASLWLETVGSPAVLLETVELAPMDDDQLRRLNIELGPGEVAFFAPVSDVPFDCANRLRVDVTMKDVDGGRYPSKSIEQACQKLTLKLPAECSFAIDLTQEFPGCGGSPDVLRLRAGGFAEKPAHVTIESGPPGSPTLVDAFEFVPTPERMGFTRSYELDVKGHAGEQYPTRATLVPLDPALRPGAEATLEMVIDRGAPTAEILLPASGARICLAPDAQAPPLDLLVRFDDALATRVEPRASWREAGGEWLALPRICDGPCQKDDPSVPVARALRLSWNARDLPSGLHELRLEACDRSGNVGSATSQVLVTRDAPTLQFTAVRPLVFSPNGDGLAEVTQVTVRLPQPALLSAQIHAGDARGPVVRTLFEDVPHAATDVAIDWDGLDGAGHVVADGEYAMVVSAGDTCGGASERSTRIVVDTTPPEVAIAEPTGGQRVSASIEVLGTVSDAHLSTWKLDVSCAGGGFTQLAHKTFGVSPGTFLARWDTRQAPVGECQLRLVAEDQAQNKSPEVFATATVERGAFLDGLSATPEVFSPNGDGRRETTTIGYVLARAARVFLEVRDAQGHVLASFESGSERAAGAWSHAWDGLDPAGRPAAEGVHVVWVRAEDPATATVYEEKTLSLDLDRTPPALKIARPKPEGFMAPSALVRGSAWDRNFAEAVLKATPAGGAAIELGRLRQASASESDLVSASMLGEGPHVMHVEATDTAENEAVLDVPFFVDATPPRALIQSPARQAVLRRGEQAIPVTALVSDDHLASWALSFGEGVAPTVWAPVAQGTTQGSSIPVGSWDVRFLPDGTYTLRLVATDLAELATESRVVVVLDGTAPTTVISLPRDGGYVTAARPIVGAVTDANLRSWTLEWAPGGGAEAFQWSPLAQSRTAVAEGPLVEWSPLPADGLHTLRLTAHDQVDLVSTARVTVTVDTTPPATPTGLRSSVARAREGYGDVELAWNANSEPDLAGYRTRRLPEEWSDLVADPARDDGERLEGRYVYEVLAEDRAGNRSAPARLDVVVDLTPPLVSFAAPAADGFVSGAVEVRGTAWSADDFAEYRLLVGAGEAPVAWTLLRRSSVGVAAGPLGDWLALSDGPYQLALEAEDLSGNQARVTRRVVVDTEPPQPPVLIEVSKPASPVDSLVPSWQPSPSADVVGTLVYRNGRLANASGIAIGDRRSFAVPGTTYEDEGLPDGDHCYRVVAIDGAGNESLPSNEICQALDNRAPRAIIVNPPAGTRFGFPVRVIAETPDLDVASVHFERRAVGSSPWIPFGQREAAPWETTLDPDPPGGPTLDPGPYELRAVATDRTHHTDPDPGRITVVYGDTTPPPAPPGLTAVVDGHDVTLAWEATTEPDFASYRVYRDGERIAEGLVAPTVLDPGRPLGDYRYQVTAVDRDDNESEPSAPAEAIVYELELEQVVWPVVTGGAGSASGSGARPGTTVAILRDATAIAEEPTSDASFRVEGIPLAPEGNLLVARGSDAAGNHSVPSNEVVLISNAAPSAVADLEAETTGNDVSLAWSPVSDADVVGYVVRRDGERLTPAAEQVEAASVVAGSRWWRASAARDGNLATAWTAVAGESGAWTITFPHPVLVESVKLRFGSEEDLVPPIPAAYSLLAAWQGRQLPVVRVRGNARLAVEHRWPAPFLTTGVTVVLESPGGLAEVDVLRLDVRPTGSESFLDESVRDGRHTYEVAAIDRYGALGAAATVEAAVGDVEPPSAPTGLVAVPFVRDVHLTWNANPEPDVTAYVVLRDGERIATTSVPAHVDPGLRNGSYEYTVLAVDAAGHESEPSSPAAAVIDVQPVPPPAPVIVEPTDAAHPITLAATRTDVAGRALAGSTVSLEVGGVLRATAAASAGFRRLADVELGSGSDVALSPDGRLAAWSEGPDAVTVQELATGARQTYSHGGETGSWQLRFAPGGEALSLVHWSITADREEVVLLRLADGALRPLAAGPLVEHAWSPDGLRIAVSRDVAGGATLSLVDVASGQESEIARSGAGVDHQLRFSPDGSRLAYVRSWWQQAFELQVMELATGRVSVLDPTPWPSTPPSFSRDSRRLAWTSAEGEGLRVRVQELDSGSTSELKEPVNDVLDPRFSDDGEWLSTVRLIHVDAETTLRAVRATHQGTGLTVTIAEPELGAGPPDSHEWTGGTLVVRDAERLKRYLPEGGWFVMRGVPLEPGENRLVARATDAASGLASPDSDPVLVTTVEAAFPDFVVTPEALLVSPALPRRSQPAEVRVRVANAGAAVAEDAAVRVRVVAKGGAAVLETEATLVALGAGAESTLLVSWTPLAAGSYSLEVAVDPDGRIPETSEANNAASREIVVVEAAGLGAAVESDRASYPPRTTAHVTVRIANAGASFQGSARTTVEDLAGAVIAELDERPVALDWGRSQSWSLEWDTGPTWAGRYRFVVRLAATNAAGEAASAAREFEVEAAPSLLARVRPQRTTLGEGEPAPLALLVQNQGLNAPLAGASARLRLQLEGAPGPARFETVRALPTLAPGAGWEAVDTWSAAEPPGRYRALFEVEKGGAVIATSAAFVTVEPRVHAIAGTLSILPAEVLAGESVLASVALENHGTAAASAYPVAVEVVAGPEVTVLLRESTLVDLAPGGSSQLSITLATAAVPPGRLTVRLRGGSPGVTLDVAALVVHGPIAPPSPHSPQEGARVATEHPALVVNDASSPEGAALRYEFELYGDAELTQPLPGVRGVPETASRTSWTVPSRLAEDAPYWWRARASDGFSTSPWSALASFTVDARDEPVAAPVPDTPASGARVASRQPSLSVRNAFDPEGEALQYEFRLGHDEAMTDVVVSQAGIAESLGLTSWTPQAALDEDAVYYWSARATTGGSGPEDVSPWSVPVWFRVDTVNASPTAPLPLRPIGGAATDTRSPSLVVENATDPEGDSLTYRFEVDTRPSLDSAARQVSPELVGGPSETRWTPDAELAENTLHYWRAFASDGRTETASVVESFFVNAVNEAPSAPVPVDPVDGRTVGTAMPSLCLRNAVDPDGDPLSYEIEVRDATGAAVAAVVGIPTDPSGTSCAALTTPLAENQAFTWLARASDGELLSPWSPPAAFRVDAVAEPPTAPAPLLPGDGATVDLRRPALVVQNATSPDGLVLAYTFELESVAADGTATLVERVEGVPESQPTTAWTPSADLADGSYQWRARASDSRQSGPWSVTFRFEVLLKAPLSAPRELRARAGDARVRLDWLASPEPSVTGYRVYRSTTSGGQYTRTGTSTAPGFDDLGLVNGTTYYYVVTAFDASSESPESNEASARPEAPAVLVAEVRLDPSVIRAECLLTTCSRRDWSDRRGSRDHESWSAGDDRDHDRDDDRHGKGHEAKGHSHGRPSGCPDWLYATLELPRGYDPATIDVASLLAFGSVRADKRYESIVDSDRDGIPELRVRFGFEDVAPHLRVGLQDVLVVGRAGASELRGVGRLEIAPLQAALRVTPRTIQKRSCGDDVLAQLTFEVGVSAMDVSVGSIRLNGVVPVERVVSRNGRELKVKFDRAAVNRVLPTGQSVEVRVTGTVQGLPFAGIDHVRVTQ